MREWILYEIHPGTFSPEGDLRAAEKYLPELKELGVNAIEIMPIAQFPGKYNWGYDGVYPFAVHNTYGRPEDLLHFVQTCHELELSVCLDVVYNHLGPEGNYLRDFGPYFTDRYHTPWGEALNFDGAGSDAVRHYFIENALMWLRDYNMDALRLDAVHAIADSSAYPFLNELSDRVNALARTQNRPLYLIAESDRNDPGALRPAPVGQGLHATWADDFHHCVHKLLTGEQDGYYADYAADSTEQLYRAYTEGFVFTGQYSRYRQRRHGRPTENLNDDQFIICIQNHDQVGNRMRGERLSALVTPEALKLAAALLLLAPFPPLLFMGEE
ncbi:MAG: hypothetical protein KDK34_08050, partial [Leptospiraceae bacterium]|nr:hypothetical protein [Leptospiraceae bacterium]